MKRILVCVGTRPEAIKMAPVMRELARREDRFIPVLCATGQHSRLLEQALADFRLRPDISLQVMAPDQSLAGLSARLLAGMDEVLHRERPDCILVQGDTTTVMACAMCGFYHDIPVGHVEAGLRSGRMRSPFPEEMNRRVAGLVADLHFAPTRQAADNLLAEGVDGDRIFITGNTVIDALTWMLDPESFPPGPLPQGVDAALEQGREMILVTCHRRESFGSGLERFCQALRMASERFPDLLFVFPVHANPHVHGPVKAMLGHVDGIMLTEPLPYRSFVQLMHRCRAILTDSGGIQEEAASLGKPLLVLREVTERTEGIEAGLGTLVGTDPKAIIHELAKVLEQERQERLRPPRSTIYGDGQAASRIVDILAERL